MNGFAIPFAWAALTCAAPKRRARTQSDTPRARGRLGVEPVTRCRRRPASRRQIAEADVAQLRADVDVRGRSRFARECIHQRGDRVVRPPRRRVVAAGGGHAPRLGPRGVLRGTLDGTVEESYFPPVEVALVERALINVEPDQVLFNLARTARYSWTEKARGARRDRIRVECRKDVAEVCLVALCVRVDARQKSLQVRHGCDGRRR